MQTHRRAASWTALLAVTAAYTHTFLSRYLWAPLMKTAAAEFSLNSTESGVYMSAFFVGYIATQIPGGYLADRVNPKRILAACTLLGGGAAALMVLVRDYWVGIAFRLLAGLAAGFMLSSCSKVVARTFESSRRGIALGVLMASPPIGITLANLIGPGLLARFGWRGTFLTVGLLALPVAAALLYWVPSHLLDAPQPGGVKAPLLAGLRSFLADRRQVMLALAGFMFLFTTTGFPTWVNAFGGARGFTPQQTGLIATAYSAAGIAGSLFSGMIAQRLQATHWRFLWVTLGLMAALSLLLAWGWSAGMFLALAMAYGFISYLPSPHFTALAIDLSPPQFTASSVAAQNMFFQTASVLQPVVLGRSIDLTGGYTILWYAFAAAMLLAVLFTRQVMPRDKNTHGVSDGSLL